MWSTQNVSKFSEKRDCDGLIIIADTFPSGIPELYNALTVHPAVALRFSNIARAGDEWR